MDTNTNLFPLFSAVRRHAEEARANILVSLELLRRQVEENQRPSPPLPGPELTPEEIEDLQELRKIMVEMGWHANRPPSKRKQALDRAIARDKANGGGNGRRTKNRTARKRKKSAARR